MKEALLVVSFGTSVAQARASIETVEAALQATAPQRCFYRAFTSPTIRRILAQRGEVICSLEQALEQMLLDGVTDAVVQPTLMLYGHEYDAIRITVETAAAQFASLRLGAPLLGSSTDLQKLAALLDSTYPSQPGQALVLFGHGTTHFANAVYPALQTAFYLLGRRDVVVGTIEGWPDFSDVLCQLQAGDYTSACLVPLMLVAGEHAINDMTGADPNSWAQQLQQVGLSTRCVLEGLGKLTGVQALYQNHLQAIL